MPAVPSTHCQRRLAAKKHRRELSCGAFYVATLVCKPGSVLTAIYLAPRLLAGSSHLLGAVGSTCMLLHGVAPDRVYIVKPMSPWAGWALTPPFHPCQGHIADVPFRRYISVALVLGSPPAGVTRYPYPVEPGLSSSGTFRYPSAAVQPGRWNIVQHAGSNVKCLANSFVRGYTIR